MIKQDRSLERWNDLTKKHMAFICFLFLSVFLFCQYVLLSSYLPFFSSNCLLLDLNKKSINRKKSQNLTTKYIDEGITETAFSFCSGLLVIIH